MKPFIEQWLLQKVQSLTVQDVIQLGQKHNVILSEKEANTALTLFYGHLHHLHSKEDLEHFFYLLEQSIGEKNTEVLKKMIQPYVTLLF
ncbi:DUF2624 family protein [Massilibacterium senegalense]|uniref:DUF2624 family protein n=1 Tax=Massilibacterium senegalense TaxID=1632858 RepID=UPI0007810879|nr:DUF2624 family protein [Massilibacterium senegalense]